jgi:hypothetical protein
VNSTDKFTSIVVKTLKQVVCSLDGVPLKQSKRKLGDYVYTAADKYGSYGMVPGPSYNNTVQICTAR